MPAAQFRGESFHSCVLSEKSVYVQREMDFNAFCQFSFAFVSEKKIRSLKGGSFELLRMIWTSRSFPGSGQGSR